MGRKTFHVGFYRIFMERHAGRSIRMPWDCANFTERHIGRSLRVPWDCANFTERHAGRSLLLNLSKQKKNLSEERFFLFWFSVRGMRIRLR